MLFAFCRVRCRVPKVKSRCGSPVISPVQPAQQDFDRHARKYLAFGIMLIAGLQWLVAQKYFAFWDFELRENLLLLLDFGIIQVETIRNYQSNKSMTILQQLYIGLLQKCHCSRQKPR